VLQFSLLGKQFWLINLRVPCSVHLNVGGLLQRALHLRLHLRPKFWLHLRLHLRSLFSSAAAV
jgi:hypothetical protein